MPPVAPARDTNDWRFFGNDRVDPTVYLAIPRKLRKTSDRGLAKLADKQIQYRQGSEFYRYVLQWTNQVSARHLNRWERYPCKAMDRILDLAYKRYRNCVKRGGFKIKDNKAVTLVSPPCKTTDTDGFMKTHRSTARTMRRETYWARRPLRANGHLRPRLKIPSQRKLKTSSNAKSQRYERFSIPSRRDSNHK